MTVGFLSSWEERCGIAEYSRLLVEALRAHVDLQITPASFKPAPKTVYGAMGKALSAGDVAHVQHSYAFFGGMHPLRSGWGALTAALTRPTLLTVHEIDGRATGAYRLPPALETAYKRRFNRAAFLHPAIRGWTVHSGALRDQLLDLGAPPERVDYLPMPFEEAPPAPDASPLIRRLGLRGKVPLVILGFLARRKGYEVALDALLRLPEEHVLVAAGGSHAADATATEGWLREEARRRGLGQRLIITGYLSPQELEQATAMATLILAPFLEMSGSASLSYALARGKAVIASDLPENRSLPCVRLFPTGQAEALAAAVRELSGAPGAREALQRAALAYAAQHSYTSLANATVARYAQLAGEREPFGRLSK